MNHGERVFAVKFKMARRRFRDGTPPLNRLLQPFPDIDVGPETNDQAGEFERVVN